MNFLHLWALGMGVGALAIPVAVHFLTKPDPVAQPLSTIRFLKEIIDEKRSRDRLRDFLILVLRTLAIGLLAMALARPWFPSSQAVEAIPQDATARIVLIDVSQSMLAKKTQGAAWDQARATALHYLEFSPNLQANVILVGAKPHASFKSVSPNLANLRETIRNAKPLSERADVKSAMSLAGEMLSQAPTAQTELVVISDFQRTNWSNLYLDSIPNATKIQFESVAPESSQNVAITGTRISGRPVVDLDVMLEVDVANYTDQSLDAHVPVTLNGSLVEIHGRVESKSTTTLTMPTKFNQAQWVTGWAELSGNNDVLPLDDARPIAFHIDLPPKVLLLSQPDPSKEVTSTFFIEQAIQVIAGATNAREPDDQGKQPSSTIAPNRVQERDLDMADLFVLNHCGPLESSLIESIAKRVRRGKGMLYVASELVDANNLDLLARALGAGYQPPIQLVPPEGDGPRKDLFVRDIRTRQPPFEVFGEQANTALQTVRIGGGLATHTLESGLRDEVAAELSDSSALLFITHCDAGAMAVLNADLDQSNWCSQPSFLPFLGEMVSALVRHPQSNAEAFGGETLVRYLPSSIPESAALISEAVDTRTAPAEEFGKWEWEPESNGYRWTWPEPTGPGIYRLLHQRETAFAAAIAAPPAESDLNVLPPDLLRGRLAGNRSLAVRDADSSNEKSDHWWNWLIVACVLGLASEIVALRWFKA